MCCRPESCAESLRLTNSPCRTKVAVSASAATAIRPACGRINEPCHESGRQFGRPSEHASANDPSPTPQRARPAPTPSSAATAATATPTTVGTPRLASAAAKVAAPPDTDDYWHAETVNGLMRDLQLRQSSSAVAQAHFAPVSDASSPTCSVPCQVAAATPLPNTCVVRVRRLTLVEQDLSSPY